MVDIRQLSAWAVRFPRGAMQAARPRWRAAVQRRRDRRAAAHAPSAPAGALAGHAGLAQAVRRLAADIPVEHYLNHCFDLLGSGWVAIRYGMRCNGLAGYVYPMGLSIRPDPEGAWIADQVAGPNLPESRRLWRLLTAADPGYQPLDWQLDFKSGYRWSAQTWHVDIRRGHLPGVDIKTPWELARMQHLPQLAAAAARMARAPCERLAREFRSQVLDFMALNPPRWGVNWVYSMEAGIRVANWLLAYDMFRAQGIDFDAAFLEVFKRSVYEHALYIVRHLEWDIQARNNHYLANIAGLLFAAAYLPGAPETDAWLAFAVRELVREAEFQYGRDGACFEASTAYHRLSAEMLLYATALTLGLPPEKQRALQAYDCRRVPGPPPLPPPPAPMYALPADVAQPARDTPFPAWYWDRLERMAEFVLHTTRPDGRIIQIGDNDSGRFFKIAPVWQRMATAEACARFGNLADYKPPAGMADYWLEDGLDCRHVAAAMYGLCRRADLADYAGPAIAEAGIIQALAGTKDFDLARSRPAAPAARALRVGHAELLAEQAERIRRHPRHCAAQLRTAGSGLLDGLQMFGYLDFGLFVYRSQRLFLSLRCGGVRVCTGGHAHNDQLSIELWLDGRPVACDPGTYLYTPLPDRRNAYRSVRAHWAPRPAAGREPASLDQGLFRLRDTALRACVCFLEEGFIGRYDGYGLPLYLLVELAGDKLSIWAMLDGPGELRLPVDAGTPALPYSPGYGWIAAQPADILPEAWRHDVA